ncbi:uncharacterized protein APUU_11095S [Aspergillus puulaauensis]|uniref:Mid2 domain-containing protein n=1 Tax=Aspergillus puulaauensis TaxID=1220207 RepID=A0A7R8AHC0_9EURO|nr:uncharacterized protein APUU_11095S [Aspergillus puulaauensis]BCS18267.1 hypothetical protein APUU_11095S [Aspergillus puulaauensis]
MVTLHQSLSKDQTLGWEATLPMCTASTHPTDHFWVATSTTTFTGDDVTSSTLTPEPQPTAPSAAPGPTSTSPTDSPDSTSTDTPDSGGGGSGTNVGAIVGGVVGGFAGLSLLLLAAWYILHRRKHKSNEMRELGEGYTSPAGTATVR